MLDRVLRLIVTLTLLLLLLQAVIGVLGRVIGSTLVGAVSVVGHAGSFIGSVLVAVATACLVAGLVVRLGRFAAARDPHVARERKTEERSVRQSVRRQADDVPLEESKLTPDSDPTLDGMGGGRE